MSVDKCRIFCWWPWIKLFIKVGRNCPNISETVTRKLLTRKIPKFSMSFTFCKYVMLHKDQKVHQYCRKRHPKIFLIFPLPKFYSPFYSPFLQFLYQISILYWPDTMKGRLETHYSLNKLSWFLFFQVGVR